MGAAAGYKEGPFRVELGVDYSRQGLKSMHVDSDGGLGAALGRSSLTGATGTPTGSVENLSFMLNAIWDVKTGTRWTPYIGVGIGGVRVALDNVGLNSTPISSSADMVFGYQPMIGVNYALSDRLQLGIQYRYVGTVDDPSFKDAAGRHFTAGYRSHNLLVGLTYHFGVPVPAAPAPAAAAPVPAATPAVVPAAAPATSSVFLVYFAFDKAALTPEGKRVIAEAAQAFKKHGAARVAVTGYTDLAGSDAYDLDLSRRRAEAVRADLVKEGVPSDAIGVAWRGKQDPRVPTADGVREPRNRRVEIVIP
jgi:outer membrane protein OmpA-like peptidoglycan-associated protein